MKLKYEGKLFDTKKKYRYVSGVGTKYEEIFLLRLELRTYMDGECYGTNNHYGYVFIVDKIIKKFYNRRTEEVCNTLPDLYQFVKEEK